MTTTISTSVFFMWQWEVNKERFTCSFFWGEEKRMKNFFCSFLSMYILDAANIDFVSILRASTKLFPFRSYIFIVDIISFFNRSYIVCITFACIVFVSLLAARICIVKTINILIIVIKICQHQIPSVTLLISFINR